MANTSKKTKDVKIEKTKNNKDVTNTSSVINNVKFHGVAPKPEGNHVAIKLVNITKTFLNGTIKANTNISFEIFKNEVHALIGENGAGKSTLTSIIFGLYEQDSGEIYINGQKVRFKSASDARKHKIGMVHQHFKLVENYTVLENIILGVEPANKLGLINFSKARRKLWDLINKYGFNINLNDKVSSLTVGQQQKVEILKLLYLDLDILIFDEPTAVLSDFEIEAFLEMIKDFKKVGKTIIIISHKLNEIKEVADFATVIRHGEVVGHYDVKKSTVKDLAEAMVGRTLKTIQNDSDKNDFGDVILEVKNLPLNLLKNSNVRVARREWVSKILIALQWSDNLFKMKKFFLTYFYDYPRYYWKSMLYRISHFEIDGEFYPRNYWKSLSHKLLGGDLLDKPKLEFKITNNDKADFTEPGISIKIREGEIFALAGVEGNGQSEFVEFISGLKQAPYSTIWIKDNKEVDISYKSVGTRYKLGMSFVPEDRHKHGLFLDESIAFNTASNQLYKRTFNKFGFLDFPAINNNALNIINDFDVRGVSSLQDDVRGLSGGNQQKLIIGREIEKNTKFVIFTQPTRGLDLGAIEYIHSRILQAKAEKKAILLLSYELDEILSLADTIAVFNKNRIVGLGSKKEMTRKKIAELMADSSSKNINVTNKEKGN